MSTQALGEPEKRIAAQWLGGRAGVSCSAASGAATGTSISSSSGTAWSRSSRSRRDAASEFGDPVEAVNWRKQTGVDPVGARSGSTGTAGPPTAYRFDVVGVLMEGARVRIRHVQNAFALT